MTNHTTETIMQTWAEWTCYGSARGKVGPSDYGAKISPGEGSIEVSALIAVEVDGCFAAILVPTDRHQWRQAMLDHYGRGKCHVNACPWIPEPWRRQFWERVAAVVAGRNDAARIAGDRE